ncbi:MAG: serine O-acetyltransferase [Methylobacter sp.]
MSRVLGRGQLRPMPPTSRMADDIDAAHRRRWPGRRISWLSRLGVLLSSSGLQAVLTYRIAHWLHVKRNPHHPYHQWFWRILLIPLGLLKLAVKLNAKIDIGKDCVIESGVCFSDQGQIIFGCTRTGAGTVIGTRVTVGMSHVDRGRPDIGRYVWIGSDCVIYGAISIGDGATLLPGTVLTKSVPAGVVMAGNPARLLSHNFDNAELRAHRDIDAMRHIKALGYV